jgi:hypothetical protein
MKRTLYCLLALASLLGAGCHSGASAPDVSGIKVTLQIKRFDQDLFALDSNHLPQEWPSLVAKYPAFAPVFLRSVLGLEQAADSPAVAFAELRHFLSQNQVLKDSVFKKFASLDNIRTQLEQCFRYVKYYYPDYTVPAIIPFIGNFGGRELYTQDGLAIGLDFYMGSTFSYYQIPEVQEVYPDYISRRFAPEYLPVNCMAAIVDDLYPAGNDTTNLLAQIIDRGRRLYILDKFLPGVNDTLKLGYTGAQYAWCKHNEGLIWSFLVQQNVLYSLDPDVIKGFMGDAPSTQSMPSPSPGNIGSFVGWQIVRRYVSRKGDPGPKALMGVGVKDILAEAQYNPK